MSSAEGEPLDAGRATNHFEPAIESNGCSSNAKQGSSNGHMTTIDSTTITKTTPDEFFDSTGDGLDATAELASDPVVIPSGQDNLCDKEQPHAKPNEEQVNVSTIAIENNQEKEVNTKDIVGDKQPDLTFPPKSILRNQPTAEPTFQIESRLQTSNEIPSEVKDQPLLRNPPLDKSLDVPSTTHEYEPLTDNTEPLQDTPTAPTASQDVPLTPPPAMPPPPEAEIAPREDSPSEQLQEGHVADLDPQPEEVAAEPVLVASGNLNALSSVPDAEPGSNSNSSPTGDGDNGSSQENDTIKGQMGAQVTEENPVAPAEQAKKNGHAECSDQPQLEVTVAEAARQSPVDTNLTPFLDETTAHTNETTTMPSRPPTEGLNRAGGTETGEGAPEFATVAHRGPIILGAEPASCHDSAGDRYSGESPATFEMPVETTPTPVPNETAGLSETDAPPSSQQDPAESLDGTLTAVPMADRAKEGSTEDPSQPATGDQDRALPLSAETTEITTSQSVDLVTQTAEPPPSSDPAFGTVGKGSVLVIPPHGQTEVEEPPELDSVVTGESKEVALQPAVDDENSTSAPRCRELAVKESGQGASSKQEEGTTSTTPVHEAPTLAKTGVQDSASAEPAEDIPAQSVELASATPDPQVNTNDPVVPSLPVVDPPEDTNDQLDLAGGEAAAPPPGGLVVNVQAEAEERELESVPKEDGITLVRPISNAEPAQREVKQEEPVELNTGAPSDSQPTDAVPIDAPSLPLPGSECVKDSEPVTDPTAKAECEKPIPITDTVAGEPTAPMTPQEDTPAQPVSVSGGYTPSQAEDKVEMANVEAAQNSEDRQTGVEKTPKEAPLSATELLDAHATTPKAEETASALEEPLIRLHQDQQLTESANEAAQPCDPALIAAGVNESRIDAVFQEPQTTFVREDNKAGDDPSPGSLLGESSAAVVNNLGAKERVGASLFEEPEEKAYTEGVKCYNPAAIVDAPNIEPHGDSVAESMSALEGATQDEPDVTFEIQLESLGALANDAVNAQIEPPAVLSDNGVNLGESNEIFEQPKTVVAVSEATDIPTVGGVEKSPVEPPKRVEAHDQDKGPKLAIDDSIEAEGPQTEVAQERPTAKVESFSPAHAEEQDTPTDPIHKDVSSKEVTPTVPPTVLPTEDITHVATVECPTEEPTKSVDQAKTPTNESAVQDAMDEEPKTTETVVGPVSEVTSAVPDKIIIKSALPIEFKDKQSAEPSKDESPATDGEDSVVEPLNESEELPGSEATATSVVDSVMGVRFDHGLTEGITPNASLLRDAALPEEKPIAEKSSVDRPSKKRQTEPALGETSPVDAVLASETCDERTIKEGAVPGVANEGPQSIEVQSFQQPSDVPNTLQPPQVVEGVEAVKLNGNSVGEQEAFSTPGPNKDTPPEPPTGESVATGTTVEGTTTIENSVEQFDVATVGDINSDIGGHPEPAVHGACTGQVQGDGQEDGVVVSESESKDSVAREEAVSSAEGPASGLKLDQQVIPVVDTVEEKDGGSTTNTNGRGECRVEGAALPALQDLARDEVPQEPEGRATPASAELHIHPEQDKVALGALQRVEHSPRSPAGVIWVPGDHNACVGDLSPKVESLQPPSSKPIEGEAPESSVLVQQSETAKDGEEVGAPPVPDDKPGASCPPEESVPYPEWPRLDESETSAPTEMTGTGHVGLYESILVTQSDDQRAQAPETSRMSEEPALHHIDPPAEFTIEKGNYQPVLEGATQKERSTAPDETIDTMGSHISRPPFESSPTSEHEIEPQPSPEVVRRPVLHGAPVPMLLNGHSLLDHHFIVDRSSPEQGVQDHHLQVTDDAPLNIEGDNSKDYSVVEAANSAPTHPRDTQGGGQDFSVPSVDDYPSTDRPHPSKEGASIGIEGVANDPPGPLVENVFEGSMHGAVQRSEQEQFSTFGTSGSENLARQTKEPVYFTADKAQSRIGSGVSATEPEVHSDVEQDHVETTQPNVINTNDQTLLPPVEGRAEQSREPAPDTTSTPSVPLSVTTTAAITDVVQGGAPAKWPIVGDQGEDGNAPSRRDTTLAGTVASTSPRGESAELSHEVGASTVSVLDVKPIDEPIPSGDELLSESNTDVFVAEDDVDRSRVADDGETATTVVLPDPPSTDPALSGSETIALAKLDTKHSHPETTLETLYISLLSPEEVHEQQISYLVGELPRVTVMVPLAESQTTNQGIEIQEEREAELAAEKIEAERDETERSAACDVEPNAAEEAGTAPVTLEDESVVPDESVAQEIGVSQSTMTLGEPLNRAEQEQDAGIEQLAEKAASEASLDDTISDEPAPTETSDGEPIAIATEVGDFEVTQETLKPFASADEDTAPTLPVAGVTLMADSTPSPVVQNATCPPPAEAAIITNVSKAEEHEWSEQGPPDVDITPGADESIKDLESSPSAELTIERVKVVENETPSNNVVVEQTPVEPITSTVCEEGIAEQARLQAESTSVESGRLAKEKGVAEELAEKEGAEKAAGDAAEKVKIEQEAEKENEYQAPLRLEEELDTERVEVDEAERVKPESSELRHQAELIEDQTLVEKEAQKLRDTEIAKLAARLKAEFNEREQARLLAKEKEIEEASDCPIAPSSPRSELSSITSGFDSPSQISLASHMATAPDSPRIAPEDPTPFLELPESDLILQNRSPKSINSSIAGEPPETPLGSLPNTSLLASDVTPPALQIKRPASFKLGSPLQLSTENVALNNSSENAVGSHSKYDPPPVLVPKPSTIPASTAKLYSTPKLEVALPALSDTVFPNKGGVEDLPPAVEDEEADVLPPPVPRTRHPSIISISHTMPGGWIQPSTVAESRPSPDVAKGEISQVTRTPLPSAVEPESDVERGSRCVIM